ncbi:MAG: gamma-glutamyl-gamma-aminobutyrate hydrolase family protein [Acidobacteria bacterium]|nr:MAG: gamma-glutamyl-gamma-aminobutyrate hydrolase family protein [Acidobacteriota bacterium]
MKIAISIPEKEKAKGQHSPYFKALTAAGARLEEIQMIMPPGNGLPSSGDFDGILLAGGEDVDPELYGEQIKYDSVKTNRVRDDFEVDLLEKGLQSRIPILGICRGAQLINVRFGGTLYQDLKSETALERDHRQQGSRSATTHSITVTEPDSVLRGAFAGMCRVNSLHHQAIKRLGRGLKVTAHSEDELYEAVELAEDYPFFLAVQWHPEEMVSEHPEQLKIFQDFVARCRERAVRNAATG